MSRQIPERELSLIVSSLICKPELTGQLDSLESYNSFLHDIGEVVANYCGGQVNGVGMGAGPGEGTYISIAANDSLPSLESNIWSGFDDAGWEDELSDRVPLPVVDWTGCASDVANSHKLVLNDIGFLDVYKREILTRDITNATFMTSELKDAWVDSGRKALLKLSEYQECLLASDFNINAIWLYFEGSTEVGEPACAISCRANSDGLQLSTIYLLDPDLPSIEPVVLRGQALSSVAVNAFFNKPFFQRLNACNVSYHNIVSVVKVHDSNKRYTIDVTTVL